MALITEKQALIFFALLLIVAIVIAWWMGSYEYYDQGRFRVFIAILAGFAIFVTFLFYYNLLQLQGQQQRLAALQELARINDSLLNSVLESINSSSTIIPNFVLSITPLTNAVCCGTGFTGDTGPPSCISSTGLDPVNPQTCTEKMVLSYRLFNLWQDVITSNKFINFDAVSYVANFLQRTNSSQLYDQWTAGLINFNTNTQEFGNLLFEYGLPITNQTPEEYVSVANKLIADPRYQAIFNC